MLDEKNTDIYIGPMVGNKVVDFSATAFQNDKEIELKLSDYKGKWVILLFYPADFTFICPTELSEAGSMYDKFKEINTEILSISTDTVFVHKAWHDHSEAIKTVTYPMIADPTGQICKQFKTYLPDEGLSLRATCIIDPDGILRSYDIHDNSIGRSTKEILRKLKASQFVNEHPGLVCPVNWEPGSDTLKPGMDLVGKI